MDLTPAPSNPYSQLLSLFDPRNWSPFGSPARPSWSQPILPGWTFNLFPVTEKNSRSPETEREIVAEHSYGRQLGRLTDAVAALIEERPQPAAPNKSFDELLELRETIEKIKLRAAQSRLQRLESDLQLLKEESQEDYRRIAAALAAEVEKMDGT